MRTEFAMERATRKAEARYKEAPRRAVILFTRVPEAGKTKTRMMPYLSPEECAELHVSILEDVIAEASAVPADLRVYATPEPKDPSFRALFPESTSFFTQEGEDLGVRMETALRETLEAGYVSAVLVGTDLPELRTEDFQNAFRILEQRDVVLGPTRDGGYWLIGLNAPQHAPFESKKYGHSNVFDDTLEGIRRAGLSVGCVRTISDLDEREDLTSFRQRIRQNPDLLKTRSGRWAMDHASVSVIVPSYNEMTTLPALLPQLEPFRDRLEILFADGGSSDGTPDYLEENGWTVLKTEKGRANQMNQAALQSTGDYLFFLHCDSEVPPTFPEDLRKVLCRHECGCFGIAYRAKDRAMKINAIYANHVRLPLQKIMFGDQGIFLTRERFFEAGMFPPLPIMEDLQFSLTLRDMGLTPGLAEHRIYTSPRRHPEKSFVKQMISLHQYPQLRKLYRKGVPIDVISDIYRDIR